MLIDSEFNRCIFIQPNISTHHLIHKSRQSVKNISSVKFPKPQFARKFFFKKGLIPVKKALSFALQALDRKRGSYTNINRRSQAYIFSGKCFQYLFGICRTCSLVFFLAGILVLLK